MIVSKKRSHPISPKRKSVLKKVAKRKSPKRKVPKKKVSKRKTKSRSLKKKRKSSKKKYKKKVMKGGVNIKDINKKLSSIGIKYVNPIDDTSIIEIKGVNSNIDIERVDSIIKIKMQPIIKIGMQAKITEFNSSIVTNGICTCMGIGMYINNKNYFEHVSDSANVNAGKRWAVLINKNFQNTKLTMYVFIPGDNIGEDKQDFFDNILDTKVDIQIVNIDLTTDDSDYISDFFRGGWAMNVGMNKEGIPFGFYTTKFEADNPDLRVRYEEEKKPEPDLNLIGKIAKLKNPDSLSNSKMRWKIHYFNEFSKNPMCTIYKNIEGTKVDKPIETAFGMDLDRLVIVNEN